MKLSEVLRLHPEHRGPVETDWLKAHYEKRPVEHMLLKVYYYMSHRYGRPVNKDTGREDNRHIYKKGHLTINVPSTVAGIKDIEREYQAYKENRHGQHEAKQWIVYFHEIPALFVEGTV